ncbi:MAG TPA: HD domain-containing phosphohydrolase [Streptosporangiaceae bacterium]
MTLIVAAAVLVVASLGAVLVNPADQPRLAVAFGALIVLGELARLAMPGNRETAPISMAGALGYTLLLNIGGTERAQQSAMQVVAVTAIAMTIGALPHIAVGRLPRLDVLARRLITIAAVAFAYRPLAPHLDLRGAWWTALAAMVGAVVLAMAIDLVVTALIRAEALSARVGVALADEFQSQLRLDIAVAATAIIVALAIGIMGILALLVFTGPLLVTQIAFRRYAAIRSTYLQTVRALARVTEVGGYVESGHSRRVGDLSVAIGRELGMYEAELLELEYAALMHDIGQLSLPDPIPGGATVFAGADEQLRIAKLGAEVIRQAGVLEAVANIVEHQCEPYKPNPELPLASRVIRVANAYDDMVGGSGDHDRSAAALDRLRHDVAIEFDPDVVEALARVIDRLGHGRF